MSETHDVARTRADLLARARFAFDPAGADAVAIGAWMGGAPDWLVRAAGETRRVRAALVADRCRPDANGWPAPNDDTPAARLVALGQAGCHRLCHVLALTLAAPRLRHMIRREDVLALGEWPDAAGWDVVGRVATEAVSEESGWLASVPPAELAASSQAIALGLLHRLVDARPDAEAGRLRVLLPARPTDPVASRCDGVPAERAQELVERVAQWLTAEESAA